MSTYKDSCETMSWRNIKAQIYTLQDYLRRRQAKLREEHTHRLSTAWSLTSPSSLFLQGLPTWQSFSGGISTSSTILPTTCFTFPFSPTCSTVVSYCDTLSAGPVPRGLNLHCRADINGVFMSGSCRSSYPAGIAGRGIQFWGTLESKLRFVDYWSRSCTYVASCFAISPFLRNRYRSPLSSSSIEHAI